jgi:hypothetical protein
VSSVNRDLATSGEEGYFVLEPLTKADARLVPVVSVGRPELPLRAQLSSFVPECHYQGARGAQYHLLGGMTSGKPEL